MFNRSNRNLILPMPQLPTNSLTILDNRALVAITGADHSDFLQGLISNDMKKVAEGNVMFATLLTPQGKFLFDFFVMPYKNGVMLDCDASVADTLMKKLRLYKLRSDVEITNLSQNLSVVAIYDQTTDTPPVLNIPEAVLYIDPRKPEAGFRAVLPRSAIQQLSTDNSYSITTKTYYNLHRLKLGLPDGCIDLTPEKSTLLESGYEELNAIDWDKGCYMGQELTARTKYRGLVKKRMTMVTISGPIPDIGADIMQNEKNVGEMRSSQSGIGLALLRIDALDNTDAMTCLTATVTPNPNG